ncbi:MAG: ROK family glucokinase [Actinomycetaceae bacterium]|nr:ROK family glucokinase [Actinomycetaceae bacterium]
MGIAIGVDVGGTKIAVGAVNEAGELLTMVSSPTPAADPQSVLDTIVNAITKVREQYEVSAVGVGAPGFIDASRKVIRFSPNISWENEPLADRISEATGLPVFLENDANSAAWAEYKFGAARGAQSVAVITVGTGIGGGIVIDGKLVRGAYGFGGEIGHMNMVPDGRVCGCGEQGCWEMYSSGSALKQAGKDVAARDPEYAKQILALGDGTVEGVSGRHVTQAARAGDPAALDCYGEIGKWLGQGMADLAALLDPEVFILAGGVSEAGNILLEPAVEQFESRLTACKYRHVAPVRLAELGNEAGIIGAADLARMELQS